LQGPKGGKIPIPPRIVSIVYSYDVMIKGRPYKVAMCEDETMKNNKILRNKI